MSYKYFSVIWIVSIFLLFLRCNKNPVESDSEDQLVPLSVGNYWAYQMTAYIAGELIEGLTDSAKVEITGEKMVNYEGQSYQVAIMNWFYPGTTEPTDYNWFLWNGEDGLYNFGGMSRTDTLVNKVLELKYPAQKGDSWQVPHLVYDLITQEFLYEDTLTYTCVATEEKFETFVGTFKCYVYHYRRRLQDDVLHYSNFYNYYAPGIGLVAQVIRGEPENNIQLKQVLYDYFVN